MRDDRFLVLVKKDYAPRLKHQINTLARPGWGEVFKIKELGEKKDARKLNSIAASDTSYDLIQQWNNGEFKQILADKDLAFDRKILNDAGIIFQEGSVAVINSKIHSECIFWSNVNTLSGRT